MRYSVIDTWLWMILVDDNLIMEVVLLEGVYMQNPSPHKLHQHQDFVNPP